MTEPKLKKVLIAEDEPDIRRVLRISLELIGGLEVKECENGKIAIEEANDFKPDLILLDVMMPVMDGKTTIKILKENADFDNIPIVFLTAKAMEEDIISFKELGATDVLTKPFNPGTLHEELKIIWNKFHEKT